MPAEAQPRLQSPDWNRLFETAAGQEGLFTTQQAAEAGYSPQLLAHHLNGGRVIRVLRGVYRLVHFPAGEHEDLVRVWLWSDRVGVLSHQTALSLHGLSDALPSQIHLTLPQSWRRRRLKVPSGVALHYGDVTDRERVWSGAVPITSVPRTLNDCARAQLAPDLLLQAAQEARRRGLTAGSDLIAVEEALRPFGGLSR